MKPRLNSKTQSTTVIHRNKKKYNRKSLTKINQYDQDRTNTYQRKGIV